MRLIVGCSLVMALVLGVGYAQMADTAADVAAINAVREAYIAAETAGDAAAVAALYADNATLMPSNHAAVSGKSAIEAFLQQQYAAMSAALTVTPRETKAAGDMGYDTGTTVITLTPKAGGKAMSSNGKYAVTLARQADKSWKITNLIYNEDMPMPMGGAGK
jgi:uncharacterized protein (TIGR02246 family)